MAAKKVTFKDVPENLLGDLEVLVPGKIKEYTAIGENIYELSPSPATIIMDCMSDFTEMLMVIRKKRIEHLIEQGLEQQQASRYVASLQDILSDSAGKDRIIELIKKLSPGVDDDDFQKITMGQLLDVLNKSVKVNIDTLPASFRANFLSPVPQLTPAEPVETPAEPAEEADETNP